MYAWPQYGGACIVQRAVGAFSTDIPCAGSALAVLACRISVIFSHQSLLWATDHGRQLYDDRQLYLFYHQLLTIRCVLQAFIKRMNWYFDPVCKVIYTPGEAGLASDGKPVPHDYKSHLSGFAFTYFSINNVKYLSTTNEFYKNRLSILANLEIKDIVHQSKNQETLTNQDQIMIKRFHNKYDSQVVSSMKLYSSIAPDIELAILDLTHVPYQCRR